MAAKKLSREAGGESFCSGISSGIRGLVECALCLVGQCGEACRIVDREIGQDFAIQLDSRHLQSVNELGIARAIQLGCSANPDDPKRAKLTLFLATANVGELKAAFDSFLRCLIKLGFCEEVTTRSLEHLFAAVVTFSFTFYAWHGVLLLLLRCAAGGRICLFTRCLRPISGVGNHSRYLALVSF